MSSESDHEILEPIAVIGLSFRFPQDATSSAEFWKMLEERRCTMSEWPSNRLNIDAFYHPDKNKRSIIYSRGGNFMKEDLGAFDSSFFSLSAEESKAMDPQHRLLLETSYRALENAGISLDKALGTNTGVYTGSMADDYRFTSLKDIENIAKYSVTGLGMSLLANRISWFFNFGGPSINFDSACSSSLMALDVACQGLRNGDSSMALVAGASLTSAVETWIMLSNMDFLSSDSKCYSFDSRANGYARGEGVGVVVLKKLSDALKDNDTIRAVIRSTGSNSDGHTPGITQPSKIAQSRLIRGTYDKAGLDPAATRYFEAHGTGTPIGDPIEAEAIGSVFRSYRTQKDPLYIGAVKSNIGHLEGGSGIAGLIKTILVLEKGIIPPNTNFEHVNPNIDFEFLNIKFPTKLTAWPCQGLRRASVNSFGFGGSNSHCVVDDAYHFLQSRGIAGHHNTVIDPRLPEIFYKLDSPPLKNGELNGHKVDNHCQISEINSEDAQRFMVQNDEFSHKTNGLTMTKRPILLIWSAADEEGVDRISKSYTDYFQNYTSRFPLFYLQDLAYTLAFRRTALEWRSYAVVDDISALQHLEKLRAPPTHRSAHLGIGFVFTGQGAQYSRMGIELLRYSTFAQTIWKANESFKRLGCTWSLFDELMSQGKNSNINDPAYSQPLCTALQIGLVDLLRSFGIVPSIVLGHSSGEIAAAYAVGGLSLESACKVSYFRGKLASALRQSSLEAQTPGAMMSVNLKDTEVHSYVKKILPDPLAIAIACFNSHENVTLSGSEADIDLIRLQSDSDGIFAHKIQTGVAYHSSQMNKIALEYSLAMGQLKQGDDSNRKTTMISSVTAERVFDISTLSRPDYWVTNMVSPVMFAQAFDQLVSRPKTAPKRKLGSMNPEPAIYDVLEIGPHPALQRAIKDMHKKSRTKNELRYHSTLSRNKPALVSTMQLVGQLYSLGYPIRLDLINQLQNSDPSTTGRKTLVDLPEYPFNHSRSFWHESRVSRETRLRQHAHLELLGSPMNDNNPLHSRWRRVFDILQTPWLQDHKVNGKVIYPAAGMVVMAMEGAKQMAQPNRIIKGFRLRDTVISNPIPIADEGGTTETQLYMRPIQNSFDKDCPSSSFRIYVVNNSQWKEVIQGKIQVEYESEVSEVDRGHAEAVDNEVHKLTLERAFTECGQVIAEDKLYQSFPRLMGLDLGPSFQALHNISYNGSNVSVGEIKTFDWGKFESPQAVQTHTIHPTTLDAAVQLSFVSLTKGLTKNIPTTIPTRIQSAWISNTGLGYPEPGTLRAYCTAEFKGPQKAETSSIAVDETGNVRLVISALESSMVSDNDNRLEDLQPRKICYNMSWKADVTRLTSDQILHLCSSVDNQETDRAQFFRDLDFVTYYFALQALNDISKSSIQHAKPHLQKYIETLRRHIIQFNTKEGQNSNYIFARVPSKSTLITDAVEKLNGNAAGRAHIAVGKNLKAIVQGEIDPLEILFSDKNLAEGYYQEGCNRGTFCRDISKYVDLLAHKNPGMKVLEVGAGKGTFTDFILPVLLHHKGTTEEFQSTDRFASYDYTDISKSFFEKAREQFGSLTERINFEVLNIEEDPANQGFKNGSYDLVLAHSVLHATSNLAATVSNCRKLLKPGGKLIMLEITQPELMRTGFVFGILEGWWPPNTEDFRLWSLCVSEETWDKVLRENGFSGVDFSIHDFKDSACHELSIIVSTVKKDVTKTLPNTNIFIIIESQSPLQHKIADAIKSRINSAIPAQVSVISIQDLSKVENLESAFVVFIPELEYPFLYDILGVVLG